MSDFEKFEYSDLLEERLATLRVYRDRYKMVKYSKKVFYGNKWNEDPRLIQARGLVLSMDNHIVARPFQKIFNHHENGTECNRDLYVAAARKVNGFLICLTYTTMFDEFIINTTGTMDSDFVTLGKKWLDANPRVYDMAKENFDVTFMFEVCDESDQHIIAERPGLYLLAARTVKNGGYDFDATFQFELANEYGILTPEVKFGRFGDIVREAEACRHEGYVVRAMNGEYLMKLKSPFYLTTKFLARGTAKIESFFDNPEAAKQRLDEEYYPLVDAIVTRFRKEHFMSLADYERADLIRGLIKELI